MQFSDAMDGNVVNRLIYTVLGVTAHGERSILSPWASEHVDGQRAKYWLRVLAEIKNRQAADVLMAAGGRLPTRPDGSSEAAGHVAVSGRVAVSGLALSG